MSDITKDFDFTKSVLSENNLADAGEGSAPAEGDQAAQEGESAPDRPRDDQGRFVPQPGEGEEAGTDTPAEGDDGLLAGKYRTVEELVKGYQELDALNARQGNEVGQLRKEFNDLVSELEEEPEASPSAAPQDYNRLFERNPVAAAEAALAANDGSALAEVVSAWEEMDEVAALKWQFQKSMEARDQQWQSRFDQAIGPVQKQTADQQFEQQVQRLHQQLPDLGQVAEHFPAVAGDFPELAAQANEGDPEARVRAVRALYDIVKGRGLAAGTPSLEQGQQGAQPQAEVPFVASATPTNPVDDAPPDAAQVAYEAMVRKPSAMRHGWSRAED